MPAPSIILVEGSIRTGQLTAAIRERFGDKVAVIPAASSSAAFGEFGMLASTNPPAAIVFNELELGQNNNFVAVVKAVRNRGGSDDLRKLPIVMLTDKGTEKNLAANLKAQGVKSKQFPEFFAYDEKKKGADIPAQQEALLTRLGKITGIEQETPGPQPDLDANPERKSREP